MSNKEHEAKERFRPGDIFEGYYFPGVLCGRTLCYYRDVVKLLQSYKRKVQNMGKEINYKSPGTFKLFSQTYKEMKFSAVQFCTEIEEKDECFQILLGVVIRLFNRRLELDSTDTDNAEHQKSHFPWKTHQKKMQESLNCRESQATFENHPTQRTIGKEDILDLNVSMMIMDSLQDTSEDQDDNTFCNIDLEELHHNVTIIYLLFLIFKSQYKTALEDGQEQSQTFECMRIPVTIETLETIKKVVKDCDIKGNVFPETKLIVNNMVREGILLPNLYDGPQYYYQDRYGNPLMPDPLEKRFLEAQDIIDSTETSHSESQQQDEKSFMDYLQNLRIQIVQKIEAKSLQIQKEEQKEEAQALLETFQQLLNEFDEKLSEYELFKLKHLHKLNSVDLKVSKDIFLEERDDKKKRKIDDTLFSQSGSDKDSRDNETSFPRLLLSFSGDKKNEYGDWKELFNEKNSNTEEVIEEHETNQEEITQLGEKTQNSNALDQDKSMISNNYSETNQESHISDNSLLSILNRIEELVNREI
ncbi:uncharacterized protein cubi_03250 [Cryptosporidium ubiquitum]|uniref:Uncharacterized protein n=1 Tax=Cryptosporidium ubiquitum TaxID=857276 RepID=A0A1J4M9P8_9CRYT|nr:uncharacterized protein cubi_03250 [Cryptosporidium ubiquitum]OII70952.1 hypothetical protein cubi_03250 [Cryptosporidium ubiquitum]